MHHKNLSHLRRYGVWGGGQFGPAATARQTVLEVGGLVGLEAVIGVPEDLLGRQVFSKDADRSGLKIDRLALLVGEQEVDGGVWGE